MKWYIIFIFFGFVGCGDGEQGNSGQRAAGSDKMAGSGQQAAGGEQQANSRQRAAGSGEEANSEQRTVGDDDSTVLSSQSTVDSSQLVADRKPKAVNRELKIDDLEPKKGWTELNQLIPEIVLDMRYATTNNFVKKVMYPCPRCFVKTQVAEALQKAQTNLNSQYPGYRFKMYDCYRPKPVQQKLWNIVPDPNYVTPPQKGSMHNRGLALDITIVDDAENELDMGTEFDFFGPEAHFDYLKHPQEILDNRRLLRRLLEDQGFKGIRTEWWHFSLAISGTEVSDWEWDCDY